MSSRMLEASKFIVMCLVIAQHAVPTGAQELTKEQREAEMINCYNKEQEKLLNTAKNQIRELESTDERHTGLEIYTTLAVSIIALIILIFGLYKIVCCACKDKTFVISAKQKVANLIPFVEKKQMEDYMKKYMDEELKNFKVAVKDLMNTKLNEHNSNKNQVQNNSKKTKDNPCVRTSSTSDHTDEGTPKNEDQEPVDHNYQSLTLEAIGSTKMCDDEQSDDEGNETERTPLNNDINMQ
ncbi:uncharacterized protein LOC131955824 [Physella acuta]|uniref:uncharacterized protein LOC131955824 n=1 Tax=Physella acuta TaxID=109671 RepID=UPI0027DDCE52|nr:uncharacterized protein LOC131955824 [Physella acuta]